MDDDKFQEMLDQMRTIGKYNNSPLWCFYIEDNGQIEFRHRSRDDLLGADKSNYILRYGDVAMFETKAEALQYLSEEQPALLRLMSGNAADFVD